MTLGRFGGRDAIVEPVSGGTGGEAAGDLMQSAREALSPSPEGSPAVSQQLAQYLAGYGVNLLINGSFESWSAGTTSAPDGWTLTGAGATLARTTASGDVQEGQAAMTLTAALNTATDLARSLTISATVNSRLRGREVTFSARVRASTASRVFLRIDDGVGTSDSRTHVGDGNHETLAITRTLDAAATKVECSVEISSGASIAATCDSVKLEEGAQATAFTPNANDAFVQPRTVLSNTSTTTSSTTVVDLNSMSLANVIVDGSQSVIITFTARHSNDTANARNGFSVNRGATEIFDVPSDTCFAANLESTISLVFIDVKPAAGNYTYKITWVTTAGTATAGRRQMCLTVIPSA